MIHNEFASASAEVSPQAVIPWPPRMQPTDCGFASLILAMSNPSWNPGRRHGTHATLSPKISLVQLLPIGSRRDRDPRVRVQVIDVRRVHQPVHRRVDARRRPTLAMQAVVERRHHLVLPLHPGVDVHQRLQPIQPQRRQPLRRQRPEISPGPLTHSSSTSSPVTGSVSAPFADVFPPA